MLYESRLGPMLASHFLQKVSFHKDFAEHPKSQTCNLRMQYPTVFKQLWVPIHMDGVERLAYAVKVDPEDAIVTFRCNL